MPTPRICQISDDTFGGFEMIVDIDFFYTSDEIVQHVKNTLISSLERLHLPILVQQAQNKNLHIHDINFCQIHSMENNAILYVCGHC